jgi:hypothetical protein
VFFDEINAEIDNSNVYDLFLTVLEDGIYLRGSQRFKLDPCAWLFAGTRELADETNEANEDDRGKEPDFKSRLTIKAVRLDQKGDESDERRSFIYQGALQLQNQHTDVKKVSAQVLKAFASLDLDKTNSRKIRQLAGRFRNIQYGEVRERNLPDELKKSVEKLGNEKETDFRGLLPKEQDETAEALDNILVEIKRQPDSEDYGEYPLFAMPRSKAPI